MAEETVRPRNARGDIAIAELFHISYARDDCTDLQPDTPQRVGVKLAVQDILYCTLEAVGKH